MFISLKESQNLHGQFLDKCCSSSWCMMPEDTVYRFWMAFKRLKCSRGAKTKQFTSLAKENKCGAVVTFPTS